MITKIIPINCKFCGKLIGERGVIDERATLEESIALMKSGLTQMAEARAWLEVPENITDISKIEVERRTEHLNKESFILRTELMKQEKMLTELPEVNPREDIHHPDNSIADVRCGECEAEKGSFKDEVESKQ